MNIFRKILKNLKKKKEISKNDLEKQILDKSEVLANNLINDLSSFQGKSFEDWTEEAKKENSINTVIFSESFVVKNLKDIKDRDDVIKILKKRKKYEEQRNI